MHLSSKLLTLPLVLALALVGCGGAQKKAGPVAATDACGAAGTNTAHLLAASAPATMAADIAAAIERHCRADAWTAQAQSCIAKATDDKAMDLCDPLLTEAQKDAAGQEIGEIAGKAMGGAGYGGATYGAVNP